MRGLEIGIDMRAPIRRQLVATFQREFKKKYPRFLPMKLPPGDSSRIWERELAPHLVFFVMLDPFDDEDSFVVEIAWNDRHEFPWVGAWHAKIDAPCGRERVGLLCSSSGKDVPWDLAPEREAAMLARFAAWERGETAEYPPPPAVDVVIPRIGRAVDDALQKLQEYGIPLFQKVADHRGIRDLF